MTCKNLGINSPYLKLCVFLGFVAGYKGVVCYDRSNNKLILSRHVVHDESVLPYKLQGSPFTGNTSKVQNTRISHVVQVSTSGTNTHIESSQSQEQQTANSKAVEEGSRHNT